MIGPYLQAKWRWYRGESLEAVPHVDALAGGSEGAPALVLPHDAVERWAPHTFENFLAGALATDEYLIAPFEAVAASLWRRFPGQVAIHVLEQRAAATAPEVALLDTIAEQGMLSFDPADRDLVGRVVLAADGAPTVFAAADVERLRGLAATGRPPADRLTEVVLDAVFHGSRVTYPETAEGELMNLSEDEPELLDLAANELGARAGDKALEIVRVGMRIDDEGPECLASLVEAIRARRFEDFARDCLGA